MSLHRDWDIATEESMRLVTPPARLSAKQKAAVIVRLLLTQNVSPVIERLSPHLQAELARTMATLGPISRATLAQVVQEFTTQLDAMALTAPNGLSAALALLEPHISPQTRDGLRAEAEASDLADPWTRLGALESERLRPLLMSESAEVGAIMLSKLGVAKAAGLLAELPADRAEMIAHAMALTATVTPAMVDRIGDHLLGQVRAAPPSSFRASPVDRVGALLNAVSAGLRDTLLGGLETRDAQFANDVRRAIFTFQHIPKRVEPADVPKILRRVDAAIVTRAIAAGMESAKITVEFLLENMSKRLAEQIRGEAENMGKIRPDEGEAAMGAIVTAIRNMEEEGELRLIPVED